MKPVWIFALLALENRNQCCAGQQTGDQTEFKLASNVTNTALQMGTHPKRGVPTAMPAVWNKDPEPIPGPLPRAIRFGCGAGVLKKCKHLIHTGREEMYELHAHIALLFESSGSVNVLSSTKPK